MLQYLIIECSIAEINTDAKESCDQVITLQNALLLQLNMYKCRNK